MVTSSESVEGDGQSVPFSNSYTSKFYELFPFYLSIGMTPEQYWDGDPALPKYYRKSDEIKRKRQNTDLWLQGMYIYEALCDVAPIFHAFAKKGTKPQPYPDHPYALTKKDREEENKLMELRAREKAKRYMEAKLAEVNKRFKSK